MHKILKYKWDDRNKHFFTSDWHIHHDPSWDVPIWKMRGYASPDDHADDVIEKVNARVGEDDILWNLGDMFLNSSDERAEDFLNQIKCKNIHKLWGNHTSNTYRIYKNAIKDQYNLEGVEVYPLRWKNVVFMGNHLELFIGKQRIILNHFAQRIWHKNVGKWGTPSWQLSGHSHLSDKTRHPDFPLGKSMDLGWDHHNDIWSFEEIEEIMETKTAQILDHHDSATT